MLPGSSYRDTIWNGMRVADLNRNWNRSALFICILFACALLSSRLWVRMDTTAGDSEGVMGDVIDRFEPSASMSVMYGGTQLHNGCEMKPSAAEFPPTVQIEASSDAYFTLVMTDPDAPSPSNPVMREWVHWIVANIPGSMDATKGTDVLTYAGPTPPMGIHRYIFVLFEQPGKLTMAAPPVRSHFNTRNFAAKNGLGPPVAAVYFNAQKEARSRQR